MPEQGPREFQTTAQDDTSLGGNFNGSPLRTVTIRSTVPFLSL